MFVLYDVKRDMYYKGGGAITERMTVAYRYDTAEAARKERDRLRQHRDWDGWDFEVLQILKVDND